MGPDHTCLITMYFLHSKYHEHCYMTGEDLFPAMNKYPSSNLLSFTIRKWHKIFKTMIFKY